MPHSRSLSVGPPSRHSSVEYVNPNSPIKNLKKPIYGYTGKYWVLLLSWGRGFFSVMDFMHFMSILSKTCILFNSVLPIKILKSYIHIHTYIYEGDYPDVIF